VRFVALKPDAAPEYCCSTIGSSITLVPLDRITTRQKYISEAREFEMRYNTTSFGNMRYFTGNPPYSIRSYCRLTGAEGKAGPSDHWL
jgi:hypothetical protein